MKYLVNKMKNKKGFTLMEMLIVVAIMVILVAVSIPVFTNQLDNAKKTTDEANMRAAKQAMLTQYMIDQWATDTTKYYNATTGKLVGDADAAGDPYGQGVTHDDAGDSTKAVLKLVMDVSEGTVDMEWEAVETPES